MLLYYTPPLVVASGQAGVTSFWSDWHMHLGQQTGCHSSAFIGILPAVLDVDTMNECVQLWACGRQRDQLSSQHDIPLYPSTKGSQSIVTERPLATATVVM